MKTLSMYIVGLSLGLFYELLLTSAFIYDTGEQITGPTDPDNFDSWLEEMKAYRELLLTEISYNGSVYDVEELAWTPTAYIQPQMHPFDRYFYDPDTKEYTVERFLNDLIDRYGGIGMANAFCVFSLAVFVKKMLR